MQLLVRPAKASDESQVLKLLQSQKGLEVAFAPAEFMVATLGQHVVGCARLRRFPDGTLELASVATHPDHRGHGIASRLVHMLLDSRRGPVYALALAPGFFQRHGFAPIAKGDLPSTLLGKADGICSSQQFVCMRRDPPATKAAARP